MFNPHLYVLILRTLLNWYNYLTFAQRTHLHLDNVIMNFTPTIVSMIQIFVQIIQVLKVLENRQKQILSKPHRLLHLLVGYRAQNAHHDVWINLEQNWNDFFWLTGETPQTLNALSLKLERIYTTTFRMRRGLLDFKNQVSINFITIRLFLPLNTHKKYQLSISCKVHLSTIANAILEKHQGLLFLYNII